MDGFLVLVDVLDEIDDAAVVAIDDRLGPARALAQQGDFARRVILQRPCGSRGVCGLSAGNCLRGGGPRCTAPGTVVRRPFAVSVIVIDTRSRDLLHLFPLIDEADAQRPVEESHFPQPLRQGGEVEIEVVEDLGVGREMDRRPPAVPALARSSRLGPSAIPRV